MQSFFPITLAAILIASAAAGGQNATDTNAAVAVLPRDLRSIATLAPWRAGQASPGMRPEDRCNLEDLSSYRVDSLDYEVAAETDSNVATSRIKALDRNIVLSLRTAGYSSLGIGTHSGIPDLHRCWRKRNTVVQIYETTGRCTMNSPCLAYDGFSIIVYAPDTAAQVDAPSAIRALLDNQVAAWNRHDLEGFMAGYWRSPDLTFFSGKTESRGWGAALERYRKNYQSEGKEMGKLDFSELIITPLAPDSAFVRGRFHLLFTDGTESNGIFTLVLRKFPEGWKIIHDHTS